MATVIVIVKNRFTNEDLEIEVDENEAVGKIAQDLRKELELPEKDTKNQVLTYYLIHNGVMLTGNQTLRQAGVKNQEVLTFYGQPAAAAVSRDVLMRNEYAKVLRRFSAHPHVKLKTIGSPPHLYTVTFTHKGLIDRVDGQLKFGNEHIVEITIPAAYPEIQPQVYMKTAAFHPNINPNYDLSAQGYKVCIGGNDVNYAELSIADVIARVGNYLQYRFFGLDYPWSGAALNWIREQNGNVGPFGNVPFDEVD